jgi:hypothetical protein
MRCNEAERSNSPSALLNRSGAGRVARKRLRTTAAWRLAACSGQGFLNLLVPCYGNGRVRRLPDRRRECDTPVLSEERMDAVWKTAGFFAQDDLRHSAAFLRDEKASVCKRGDSKVSGDGGIFCQHGCGAGVDERANAIKASRMSRIAPQRFFWREEILRLRSTAGAEALPQPIQAGIVCGESVEDLSRM